MVKVTAPVEGYTGTVIGVVFVDGSGIAETESQIAYFERHGYELEAATKTLDENTKAELEAIASGEGVEFKNPINKSDLLALIQAKRSE